MYSDGLSDISTTPRFLKISVKHKWHTTWQIQGGEGSVLCTRKAIREHLLAYLDKEIGTCGRTTPPLRTQVLKEQDQKHEPPLRVCGQGVCVQWMRRGI
jgi:hypothetical protein